MNKHLQENLCKKFCAYYKPSKQEDQVCKGFVVMERLIRNGKVIAFDKPDKMFTFETQEILVHDMCTVCPFYANDCDFILSVSSLPLTKKGTERPLPCGGFTLLAHLLVNDIIKIDDIRNII